MRYGLGATSLGATLLPGAPARLASRSTVEGFDTIEVDQPDDHGAPRQFSSLVSGLARLRASMTERKRPLLCSTTWPPSSGLEHTVHPGGASAALDCRRALAGPYWPAAARPERHTG